MKTLNRQTVPRSKHYPEKFLQFGEGNFLRAFVDWMVDKMNREAGFNAGVAVVQPIEQGMADLLNAQDGLYHVYLRGMKGGKPVREVALIDCIGRALNPYTQFDEYLKLAENPALRFVVSNTTEAGISFDEADTLDMRPQRSFPGKVTALLYHRFRTFAGASDKGLAIICCELIERNGDMLKKYVLRYAGKWGLEREFIDWVTGANAFCSTLVDRIVPGFPKDKIEQIHEELGYNDRLVVEGELFHLWVIEAPAWVEKEFPADKAGLNVIFTNDMTPYRDRKVRILNGAHTASFAVSYLSGVETVRESMEDPVISRFMRQVVFNEICPNVNLPQNEVKAFAEQVFDRFYNPYVRHFWKSIALNSMSKWETRVLPSLLDYRAKTNRLPKRTVFSLAALIAYYKGEHRGTSFDVEDSDDILELYKDAWSGYDDNPATAESVVRKVLAYRKNWKMDLNEVEGLTALTAGYLLAIRKQGMREALTGFLDFEHNRERPGSGDILVGDAGSVFEER